MVVVPTSTDPMGILKSTREFKASGAGKEHTKTNNDMATLKMHATQNPGTLELFLLYDATVLAFLQTDIFLILKVVFKFFYYISSLHMKRFREDDEESDSQWNLLFLSGGGGARAKTRIKYAEEGMYLGLQNTRIFDCKFRVFESQVRVVEGAEERSTSRGYPSQRMHSKGMYLSFQGTRILVGFWSRVSTACSARSEYARGWSHDTCHILESLGRRG